MLYLWVLSGATRARGRGKGATVFVTNRGSSISIDLGVFHEYFDPR